MLQYFVRRCRGSVLVYSVIILSLLLNSALALSILANSGAQSTKALVYSIPAFYAAESCLEQSLRQYVVLGIEPNLSQAGFSNESLTFTNGATCDRTFRYDPSPLPPGQATKSMTVTTHGKYRQSQEGLSVTVTR